MTNEIISSEADPVTGGTIYTIPQGDGGRWVSAKKILKWQSKSIDFFTWNTRETNAKGNRLVEYLIDNDVSSIKQFDASKDSLRFEGIDATTIQAAKQCIEGTFTIFSASTFGSKYLGSDTWTRYAYGDNIVACIPVHWAQARSGINYI